MACRLDGAELISNPMLEYCYLYVFIPENAFENVIRKMSAILSRPQCVNKYRDVRNIELKSIFI